jgi:hypothetical protein
VLEVGKADDPIDGVGRSERVGNVKAFQAEYAVTAFGKPKAGLRSHAADPGHDDIESLDHGVDPETGAVSVAPSRKRRR